MAENSVIGEIAKIGNYAVTAFAAFVTAALAVGNNPVAVAFAIYTIVSAHVSYAHRLAYLRNQKKHRDSRNLPTWVVVLFFAIHIGLLIILVGYLHKMREI